MSESQLALSRVTRSKEKARASYDKMSRWYDLLAGRFEKKYRDAGLQELKAKEGEAVLEIGFGAGDCVLALAQSVGDSGKIYGIDISERMVYITREKVERARLPGRVELICGDATKLDFQANSLDAVFMSFTLELFDTPEIRTVLQECRRVLRSGGRICVIAMSQKERDTLMMSLYGCMHIRFPNYVDCRPIFVQRALEDAGFRILDVRGMSMCGLPVDIVLAVKDAGTFRRGSAFPMKSAPIFLSQQQYNSAENEGN
jgi:demethylmenaquinone methyltransferase/2-methoxy-6-polyprenyl-1,4-benzoquinol methylase